MDHLLSLENSYKPVLIVILELFTKGPTQPVKVGTLSTTSLMMWVQNHSNKRNFDQALPLASTDGLAGSVDASLVQEL